MMIFAISIIFAVLSLLLAYIFILHPLLRDQPAFSQQFKDQATLWNKFIAKLTGWRSKIATRLLALTGLIVGLYDTAVPLMMGQDWTPITRKLPDWVFPVGLFSLSLLFSYLHKITINPTDVVVVQKDDLGESKVVGLMKSNGSNEPTP